MDKKVAGDMVRWLVPHLTGLLASVHSPTDAIAKPTEHDIGPAYGGGDGG